MAEEGLTQTKHDKIHIAKPMDINMNMIQDKLDKLDKLNLLLDNTNNEQKEKIKSTFKEIVPTYKEDK